MSGGPNTALNLGCRIAAAGIKVRIVSCEALPNDLAKLWPDRPAVRRLLFYAHPLVGQNIFGLGYDAFERSKFADDEWEFVAIGDREHVTDMPLAGSRVVKAAPWFNYANYAKMLFSSDVLLSLIVSPHTSYPVLEMVACGGLG
jgi:hypothetical protein